MDPKTDLLRDLPAVQPVLYEVVVDTVYDGGGRERAAVLPCPVGGDIRPFCVAERGEGERDGRVEVGAGDADAGVDGDHQREAVAERDRQDLDLMVHV